MTFRLACEKSVYYALSSNEGYERPRVAVRARVHSLLYYYLLPRCGMAHSKGEEQTQQKILGFFLLVLAIS